MPRKQILYAKIWNLQSRDNVWQNHKHLMEHSAICKPFWSCSYFIWQRHCDSIEVGYWKKKIAVVLSNQVRVMPHYLAFYNFSFKKVLKLMGFLLILSNKLWFLVIYAGNEQGQTSFMFHLLLDYLLYLL